MAECPTVDSVGVVGPDSPDTSRNTANIDVDASQEAVPSCNCLHSQRHFIRTLHSRWSKRFVSFLSVANNYLHRRPTPDTDISPYLSNLAEELQDQFEDDGELDHLEEAIKLHRQALQLRPASHPNRSRSLNNLATALQTQFEHGGGLASLKEAIELHREALELRPEPHPHRSNSLNNLANALMAQFEYSGGLDHLQEVIELHRQALTLRPDPHPSRFSSINNLAIALQAQFQHSGEVVHLEEAIRWHREGLELTQDPHPDRSMCLNNLANALLTQFQSLGELNRLQEVIELHRQALNLRSHPHPEHSCSLNNLAAALQTQFEYGGGLIRLEEAIELHRQALTLRPHPHPEHSSSLNSLAITLSIQFMHGGGLNYLEESIKLHREALQFIPEQHQYRYNFLSNLATAVKTQFVHSGQVNHIEEAIKLHRQALKLTSPSHPHRSICLDNLANGLRAKFQFEPHGGLNYLEEAIELHREALKLRPHSHPDRPLSLNNLASSLGIYFDNVGQSNLLEEAMALLEPTLQLLPKSNPSVNSLSSHPNPQLQDSHLTTCRLLAVIYITAHNAPDLGNNYLTKSMLAFSYVLHFPFASPFSQIECAIVWAKYADRYNHPSAIEAYDLAIRLLPQASSSGYSTRQRQLNMATHKRTRSLASNASHYAIRMKYFDKAVEYLEAARATLWSQLLQLRSPFSDQLNAVAPELGKRLEDIARVLETASHNDSIGIRMPNDNQALQLTNMAMEWKQKLDEVRKIEGFEEFLLPNRLSLLRKAASMCPIALLIPHDDGSHCLVMTSECIHHLEIPSFTTERLRGLATDIQTATSKISRAHDTNEELDENGTSRLNAVRTDRKGSKPDDLFRTVLATLWTELVKPVIESLHIERSSNNHRPILQWCPTGLFTFLPIHAAGLYTKASALTDCLDPSEHSSNEYASDYIISSYTPTIAVLLSSPQPRPPAANNDFKMLAVIAGSNLSHTRKELQNIKTRVPKECLTEVGVNGVSAHVKSVVLHFPTSSIVHFACHGSQDKLNPLNSGLALDDGTLTIAKIMKQPLPNGSLAFLCACETSMGDEELPDEAISIGASLVFSGFSSVIATMWRMMDRHGPTIADAFYEDIFRGPDGNPMSVPDFSRSAQALDLAVKKLRDSGVPFYEWVPFIHLGKTT